MTAIATRTLLIDRGGVVTPVEASIHAPVMRQEDCFALVCLKGILDREFRIFGVDTLQALQLAIEFVDTILLGEVAKGHLVSWPNGSVYDPQDQKMPKQKLPGSLTGSSSGGG
jgi:hypothetical protein